MRNRPNLLLYIVLSGLFVISFVIWLGVFNSSYQNDETDDVSVKDKLSGKTYSSGDAKNYKDANPYGSTFIGFEELSDRGVTDDNMTYLMDVLTNFTMYDQNTFNGRVSYVADSFMRSSSVETSALDSKYSFKFGINDTAIHTINVNSKWLSDTIKITILDGNQTVFDREFKILSPN